MHPQFAELLAELDAAQARLDALNALLADAEWSARPLPESWCVGECVAHLNLTNAAYVPLFAAGLQAASAMPRRTDHHRYRMGLMGWVLWRTNGPGGRMRLPTARKFVPQSTPDRASAVAAFARGNERLRATLLAADGLAVDAVTLVSPFNARVRYPMFGALALLPRHEHRHLQQAERAWASVRETAARTGTVLTGARS